MRRSALLLLAAASIAPQPAMARPLVPLVPFGLPFAPETPAPIAPTHPLYHRVTLDPVQDMPDKVGGFLTPIVNRKEMDEALRQMLERADMLAPPGTAPAVRLTVRWLGLEAPFKVSFSSQATASLSYTLTRIDNGQQIFARDIATSNRSTGGDGAERLKGNARFAILANLASAWFCLDKAAIGAAPADCALKPLAEFQAPRPPLILFLPR